MKPKKKSVISLKKSTHKTNVSQLKKKLDKVFNEFIRLRDQNKKCISCNRELRLKENMDAGHYIPKTYLATRWDEKNVNGQCSSCNRFGHGNLSGYAIGLMNRYGKDILNSLDIKKRSSTKMYFGDYEVLINFYKHKVREVKNENIHND